MSKTVIDNTCIKCKRCFEHNEEAFYIGPVNVNKEKDARQFGTQGVCWSRNSKSVADWVRIEHKPGTYQKGLVCLSCLLKFV